MGEIEQEKYGTLEKHAHIRRVLICLELVEVEVSLLRVCVFAALGGKTSWLFGVT